MKKIHLKLKNSLWNHSDFHEFKVIPLFPPKKTPGCMLFYSTFQKVGSNPLFCIERTP